MEDNKENKYHPATIEMFEHIERGLSPEQARTLVKPDSKVSKQADYKLEKKYKQWSLTQPNKVKKASTIYDRALAGKPLTRNSDEKPSNSQVLAVAKEILDRQYPKVTVNQNLNINADLSPVDLEKYRIS